MMRGIRCLILAALLAVPLPAGAASLGGSAGSLGGSSLSVPHPLSGGSSGTPAGAVTALAAGTITSSSIALTWTAPVAGTAPVVYEVDEELATGGTWAPIATGLTATAYVISGQTPATAYNIRVIASNAYGTAAGVLLSGISTLGIAPVAISGLTVGAVTTSSVALSWTAPASGTPPIVYEVDEELATGGTWAPFATGLTAANDTVTGLAAGTAYNLRVIPSDPVGAGPSTQVTATTTAAPVAPSAVLSLATGSITQTSIGLTWSAPATGATPIVYEVDSELATGGTWAPFATGLTATNNTVTGLIAGTAYNLRVISSNSIGTGPASVLSNVSTGAAGSVAGTMNFSLVSQSGLVPAAIGF